MSDTISQQAINQIKGDTGEILLWTVKLSAFLGCCSFACVVMLHCCSKVKLLNGERGALAPLVALLCPITWAYPVGMFISYHRIDLPTWLTFGYPVAFGGVIPNVCNDVACAIYPDDDSNWACLLSGLETWRSKVLSPGGWKYLLQVDEKLLLCLMFLGWQIFQCLYVVMVLRECAQRRDKQRKQRNAIHEGCEKDSSHEKVYPETGAIFCELDTTEKQ